MCWIFQLPFCFESQLRNSSLQGYKRIHSYFLSIFVLFVFVFNFRYLIQLEFILVRCGKLKPSFIIFQVVLIVATPFIKSLLCCYFKIPSLEYIKLSNILEFISILSVLNCGGSEIFLSSYNQSLAGSDIKWIYRRKAYTFYSYVLRSIPKKNGNPQN